uniref:Uncharacterized protein n=1 Tax=Schistocephalus solidus TaxID=70667 RepID=A0A0X3PZ15_SCHSO
MASRNRKVRSSAHPTISAVASATARDCVSSAVVELQINGVNFQGSTESYVLSSGVLLNNMNIHQFRNKISRDTSALIRATQGNFLVLIKYKGTANEKINYQFFRTYAAIFYSVMTFFG